MSPPIAPPAAAPTADETNPRSVDVSEVERKEEEVVDALEEEDFD